MSLKAPETPTINDVYGVQQVGTKWYSRGIASFDGFNRSMFDRAQSFDGARDSVLGAGSDAQAQERGDELAALSNQGFEVAGQARDRQSEAAGGQFDQDQLRSSDRKLALAGSLGEVSARTAARDEARNQRRFAGQFAFNEGKQMDATLGDTLQFSAQQDTRREAKYQKAKAAHKAGMIALAGVALGGLGGLALAPAAAAAGGTAAAAGGAAAGSGLTGAGLATVGATLGQRLGGKVGNSIFNQSGPGGG